MLAADSNVAHFCENMASQRPFTTAGRQIPTQLHLFSRLSKGLSNCGCLVSGPE